MAHNLMSLVEYRDLYTRMDLLQKDVADLFGHKLRTVVRHANGDAKIPASDAILLRLLARKKITIEDVVEASKTSFGAGAESPAGSPRIRARS